MTGGRLTGKRILLVEDNEKILRGNKRLLEWEGCAVDAALNLAQARALLAERRPDAMVLDIMLPDGSGMDLLRALREGAYAGVPVLLLTGLTSQENIIRGLREGGDDYLTKPYDFPVLLARLEALLRRADRVPEALRLGRLSLDVSAGAAAVDGADLLLTQKEFTLLLIFVQNPNRYIGGEYLYEKVWKQPLTGDTNALKSAIKRLRLKLAGSGWRIGWSRGEGYCFEMEYML